MQYYFDRTVPLFLTTEASFDAIPVSVDEDLAGFVVAVREVYDRLVNAEPDYGAPEDAAQAMADVFLLGIQSLDLITELQSHADSLSQALREAEADLANLEELDDDGQTM